MDKLRESAKRCELIGVDLLRRKYESPSINHNTLETF